MIRWRQVPADSNVHDRPADPPDFRWQRGEVIEAFYLGDTPETVWPECHHLAEAEIPPMATFPRDFWLWEIPLPRGR